MSKQGADSRVVQLNFPGAKTTPKAEGKPAESGNVSTNPQVIHRNKEEGKLSPLTKPPSTAPMVARAKGQRVDWDAIEPHYRAGKLTVREVADSFGLTHPAILKHARLNGWTRNLQAAIDAKAEELVTRAAVTKPVTEEALVTRNAVVNANAELIATVRLGQRSRFTRAAGLYTRLFEDLESQVMQRDQTISFAEQIAACNNEPGSLARLAAAKLKELVDTPAQIRAFKDLMATGSQLSDQEQKAYKLDKAPEGGDGSRTDLPVRFVETKYIERDREPDDE